MPKGIFLRKPKAQENHETVTGFSFPETKNDLTINQLHEICVRWSQEPHPGPLGEQAHWDTTIGQPLIAHQSAVLARILIKHESNFIIAEISPSMNKDQVVKELDKWVKALVGL